MLSKRLACFSLITITLIFSNYTSAMTTSATPLIKTIGDIDWVKTNQLLVVPSKDLCKKIGDLYYISQDTLKRNCYIAWQKTIKNHPYITASFIVFPSLIALYRKRYRILRIINPRAALDWSEKKIDEDARYYDSLSAALGIKTDK